MFALPSIAAQPSILRAHAHDATTAAMALELLPRRPADIPLALVYGGKTRGVETAALRWRLEEELRTPLEALKVFDLSVWVQSEEENTLVFLANRSEEHIDSRWTLESRWTALEALQPGLAAGALEQLQQASRFGACLYTPAIAEHFCSYTQWQGEDTEICVIDNFVFDADTKEAAGDLTPARIKELCEEHGVTTRAGLDAALPPAVQRPKRLSGTRLMLLARARGEVGEIARSIQAVRASCAIDAGRKREPVFESHDSDQMTAYGWAAAIRWNARDPMLRFFDDYGQMSAESDLVTTAHGWYAYSPGAMPHIVRALRNRLAVAKAAEDLLPMISTRTRG